MALRLMEVVIPEERTDDVNEILQNVDIVGIWKDMRAEGQVLVQAIVTAEDVEPIMDVLEQRFSGLPGFYLLLLPLEARIPAAAPEAPKSAVAVENLEETEEKKSHRISRAELYDELSGQAKASPTYLAMVILSSLVAAVGLLQDNVAVVIGAMVIAPLLGPNAALALATTLGDLTFIGKALRASLIGILAAMFVSVGIGWIFDVDPTVTQIALRTRVGIGDLVLALSSGSAGALAFTTGLPAAVIGVMMAVALLPPLVAFGLLLGSGQVSISLGALLLFVTNIICVNLAGVTTFLLQGVRPRTWWEAERAKKATRSAVVLWVSLLLVLVLILIIERVK